MSLRRGVGICHYNRLDKLGDIIKAVRETAPVDARIVVCDDGSGTYYPDADEQNSMTVTAADIGVTVSDITRDNGAILVQGPNLGVAANKNRALWALQDCNFIAILEDDLIPTDKGWFEAYETASTFSNIHHFCRVQDKEEESTSPGFDAFMRERKLTPIYGPSPRGDLTFITSHVVDTVGGFNPLFRGAGYAHGEWSNRVQRAGLIQHPQKWVDIKEGRDRFKQVGDREGGRWNAEDKAKIEGQLLRNRSVLKQLRHHEYTFCDLTLE